MSATQEDLAVAHILLDFARAGVVSRHQATTQSAGTTPSGSPIPSHDDVGLHDYSTSWNPMVFYASTDLPWVPSRPYLLATNPVESYGIPVDVYCDDVGNVAIASFSATQYLESRPIHAGPVPSFSPETFYVACAAPSSMPHRQVSPQLPQHYEPPTHQELEAARILTSLSRRSLPTPHPPAVLPAPLQGDDDTSQSDEDDMDNSDSQRPLTLSEDDDDLFDSPFEGWKAAVSPAEYAPASVVEDSGSMASSLYFHDDLSSIGEESEAADESVTRDVTPEHSVTTSDSDTTVSSSYFGSRSSQYDHEDGSYDADVDMESDSGSEDGM
ncbi:hypothetical protein EIP91_000791 [Steccherinum ochraceum]|uniref:Uncharacterized protein n=1 Tax=Steccherinum ochraceum TaxID=92696 RepID=A0A4R0RF43_9APHY|nr:hypothetical protein EIP91_000791 [Steccherinum ochraceum]